MKVGIMINKETHKNGAQEKKTANEILDYLKVLQSFNANVLELNDKFYKYRLTYDIGDACVFDQHMIVGLTCSKTTLDKIEAEIEVLMKTADTATKQRLASIQQELKYIKCATIELSRLETIQDVNFNDYHNYVVATMKAMEFNSILLSGAMNDIAQKRD